MITMSISDDDVCWNCYWLVYRPGERSTCMKGWPGTVDEDGYVIECPAHDECPPGANISYMWLEGAV